MNIQEVAKALIESGGRRYFRRQGDRKDTYIFWDFHIDQLLWRGKGITSVPVDLHDMAATDWVEET